MTYRAPVNDMLLALNHGAGLQAAVKAGHYGDFDGDIAAAVLEEAGKFASDVLAQLNRIGDEHGIKLEANKVTTAPGWPDAYQRWIAAGWNAVSGPEAFGGQGLPLAINAVCTEIWSASNIAFGLCPLLTLSAIEALDAHGSDELKAIYLKKLVSGEWTGTMHPGPKRKEGDRQVPEGCYTIAVFNPKSRFHLSLGLDYPNESDRILADPARPGGEIYIHGSAVSIGCLPLGDAGIEELYLAALDTRQRGRQTTHVHIFPARMSGDSWNAFAKTAADGNPQLRAFWENLQPVYDAFEKARLIPKISVASDGRYLVK